MKLWMEEDRPREKYLRRGAESLTEVELIAILLGTGSGKRSVLELATSLLDRVDGSLAELSRLTVDDLKQIKGVGEAKALVLLSALELGRRRKIRKHRNIPGIRSSGDAYDQIAVHMEDKPHEEFWVMFLNRANRLIKAECVSKGGLSGTVVDNRIIFKKALLKLSSGLILAHNHPSGNLNPSQADIQLTKKIEEGGKMLDIKVIDHLIITESGYFSFADEGLL